MSDYQFGVSKQKPTRKVARQMEAVARKHDARFIEVQSAQTNGYQRWFSTKNLGSPFNEATARAVAEDLRALGIGD